MYSSKRLKAHHRPFYAGLTSASLTALILVLGGCAAPAPQPSPTASVQFEVIEQSARDLARQADAALNPEESNRLRLMAAMAWLQEEDPERARFQLDQIDPGRLDAADQYRFQTLSLRILLAENRLLEALDFAQSQQLEVGVNAELRNQWLIAQADTFYLNNQFHQAANLYFSCAQEAWINQTACEQGLWTALSYLDDAGLDELQNQNPSATFQGWLDLARVAHLNLGDFSTQAEALSQWQRRYPNHSASRDLPAPLGDLNSMAALAPQRIAVLLPLSGRLESAGSAVLEGILSAYYASAVRASVLPSLSIYDTESLPLDLLIEIIRSENFDGVIGPLDRERVDQLVAAPQLEIPIVALNQLSGPIGTRIGISLAVESEARQIAQRAARDGHHTAVLVAPNTVWGDRTTTAFASTWQEQDQAVAAILRFNGSSDQAPLLESALHIDQSNQRRSALQGLLGKQLSFTPRRRGDVDMLFLAASPDEARQITPLLAFFFAEDLPIYATSSIYAGNLNTDLDRDLDGVTFLNYPWVFHTNPRLASLPSPTGTLSQDLKSLQALGVDSYYLLRRFHQIDAYRGVIYQGLTGTLTLAEDGNIERRMPWATFRSGRLVPVDG